MFNRRAFLAAAGATIGTATMGSASAFHGDDKNNKTGISETVEAVRDVAWAPDGRTLAFGADDDIAYIYNTADNALITTLDIGATIYALDFSSDGQQLAVFGGEDVTVYNTDFWAPIATIDDGETHLDGRYSPDSQSLLFASRESVATPVDGWRLYDVASGDLQNANVAADDLVSGVDITDNNEFIAYTDWDGQLTVSQYTSNVLTDTTTRETVAAYPQTPRFVSPDSDAFKYIVVGGNGLEVYRQSSGTGVEPLLTLESGTQVTDVAISPDEMHVGFTTEASGAFIYDVSDGSKSRPQPNTIGATDGIAFSDNKVAIGYATEGDGTDVDLFNY